MTWPSVPLKHFIRINPEVLGESTDPDLELRYIDIGSVGRGRLLAEPEELRFSAAPSRARRVVRAGDVIVSTVRTYLRAVLPIHSADDGLIVSTGFAVLRPTNINAGFARWLMESDLVVDAIVSRSVGVSYPAINADEIGEIRVSLPPASEQRAIGDYLDREMARVDSLIAAKRRMLGLLTSRWTSRLSEALDGSDLPMIRARYLITHIEQGWSPLADDRLPEDGEWSVLKAGAVNGMRFRRDEVKTLPPGLNPQDRYTVHDGDILMSRANNKELVGSVGIVDGVRPRTLLCDKLYRIALDTSRILPMFFVLAMSTRRVRAHLAIEATGASDSMQNVGQDTLLNLTLPCPPVADQQRTTERAEQFLDVLTQQSTTIQTSVQILQERRQAVITAAVNGALPIPGVAVA